MMSSPNPQLIFKTHLVYPTETLRLIPSLFRQQLTPTPALLWIKRKDMIKMK